MILTQGRGRRSGDGTLLMWCFAGSIAAHALLLQWLPRWQRVNETPPLPLTVELKERSPEIVPPQPMPVQTRPQPPEREKPRPIKPEPLKALPREQRPLEPPRAPTLTAPPETPVTPVVPDQRPAPPSEPQRPQSAQVAPPAAVTPPRSDAAYLNNPRPAYPLAARRRGDQGTVLIRVLVTAEGFAASVGLEKTSGHPALDEAALTAVKTWRFVPARQGGQAIESPYVVPVVFKLD